MRKSWSTSFLLLEVTLCHKNILQSNQVGKNTMLFPLNCIDFHMKLWQTIFEPITFWERAMTIEDYRIRLGWSQAELARKADIDINTLRRALSGQPIYKHTAGAIASALSQGLGFQITYKDLDGVKVRD